MTQNFWIIFFGGITAIAAILTYIHLRKADRRKTTFEAINSQIWDRDYISARNLFKNQLVPELRILDQKGISELLQEKSKTNKLEEKDKSSGDVYKTKVEVLKMIINSNELVAIGVRLGTLDEKFISLQRRGSYIADWNILSEFIHYVRRSTNNDYVGIEFETLAKKWKSKPRKRLNGFQRLIYRWPNP